MADITLISGSTLGSAEYVAEHLAEKLDDAGFSSEILHGPMLEEVPTDGIWLIISSTHGAGDIPDNLQPLYERYASKSRTCHQVRFGAIGIGSREYDTILRRNRQAGSRIEGLWGKTDRRNSQDQRAGT